MLAVVTSLPRFYHTAAEELKKEGVKFLSLRLEDDIPPEVDIVITSVSERDRISFPKVVAASSAREAVREALQIKTGMKESYKVISVGIDPGKSIGIAAVGDGKIVFEDILHSPEEVVPFIRHIEERFTPKAMAVKVGAAGGAYRNRIIARIQENFSHPMEIVDEGSTTRPKRESRRLGLHKDILAARKIAFKKGKPLHGKVRITTTPGEVKNVQLESRKKSDHLTISKRLAEAVVKGEMDLDEAIRLQKKGKD
ncbi:MAG: hypothetical protein ACE5HH_02755 [Candidatus Hydrothermarchaeales archaeon]